MASTPSTSVFTRFQQSLSSVAGLPAGVRTLIGMLLVVSCVLAVLRAMISTKRTGAAGFPFFVLVPGASWAFPWVILVAGFCATTWIEGVYYVLVLGLLAPSLEMQWGHIELLQFSAVVIAGTNILSWILALLVGLVTRSEQMLFHTHFDGMHGLITGFLVAYAQIMPEVRVPYIPKLTARDVPMLAVGLSNIPCILGYMAPFIQYQIAWLVSWVYLRFYQVGQTGQRGDASDAFAFVTWFPPFIHPVLGPVSQFVYKMASSWHLVPLQTGYMDLELSVQEPHAGGAREEAERRRTMALAALDARLADSASSKAPPTATSSQDEA